MLAVCGAGCPLASRPRLTYDPQSGGTIMAGTVVTNWFGDLVSHPQAVVEATSVDHIAGILRNPGQYPSPVRAIGSNHSTAACGVVEGGTLIKMSKMNRIL